MTNLKVSMVESQPNQFHLPENLILLEFKKLLMDNMTVSIKGKTFSELEKSISVGGLNLNGQEIKISFPKKAKVDTGLYSKPGSKVGVRVPVPTSPDSIPPNFNIGDSVNQVTPVDIYGSTVTPIITNVSAPMPNFPGMNSNAPVNKVTITSNPTGVSSG